MSTIHIEIVDIVVEKIATYEKMTVTHKVLGESKVDAKAIMSFATPKDVWATLASSQKGDQFSIDREKDAKQGKYWNWVGIHRQDGAPAAVEPQAKARTFGELDQRKQRYIIRQNALTNAVNFQGHVSGASVEDVLGTAEEFANWVLEEELDV